MFTGSSCKAQIDTRSLKPGWLQAQFDTLDRERNLVNAAIDKLVAGHSLTADERLYCVNILRKYQHANGLR